MTKQKEISDAMLAEVVEGWRKTNDPMATKDSPRQIWEAGGRFKMHLPDYSNIEDAMRLWGCLKSTQRFFVWNSLSDVVVSELHEFDNGNLAELFAKTITEAVAELVRRGDI